MSHYVPDFEIDDDYGLPSSSSLTRSKKSAMIEEDIMELLWQNGQVVTQSQNQRSMLKKPQPALPTSTSSPPSKYGQDAVISADHSQSTTREIQQQQQQHLFMQEDEMASWLHYPLNDTNFDDHDDFCGGLLYPPPSSTAAAAASTTTTSLVTETHSRAGAQNLEARPVILPSVTAAAMRPPVPPPRRAEAVPNFPLFSRHRGRGGIAASEPGPSSNNISNNTNYTPNNFRSPVVVRECTVVDSSVTPAVCCSISRVSEAAARSSTIGASSGDHGRGTISADATTTNTTANRDTTTTCEVTVTSSPGGSSASSEPPPSAPQHHPPVSGGVQDPVPEDRKRKGREDDNECHSEDAEFESANAKKQQRGSSSMKRSRAAEVHNLSERRRRDRINEKMKALQELIPRCNKSDKASMLDEAIEYLKSLQLQVQMMSMGCGMVPMMFPGVQQYMSPMGMGLGLGMPMEMGMNRPILPFPNVLAGASLSTPATAAHLGPRFPIPAFHLPSVPCPDPSRIQGANLRDPMLNSLGLRNPNQLRVPTFVDPYQQYLGLHQMQTPIAQNQASTNPSSSRPSTSRGVDHQDNNQPEGT